MNKKFSGKCPVYNINVIGRIEYKDASTKEGTEYVKLGVECDHKAIYQCTRRGCPFWKRA